MLGTDKKSLPETKFPNEGTTCSQFVSPVLHIKILSLFSSSKQQSKLGKEITPTTSLSLFTPELLLPYGTQPNPIHLPLRVSSSQFDHSDLSAAAPTPAHPWPITTLRCNDRHNKLRISASNSGAKIKQLATFNPPPLRILPHPQPRKRGDHR